jgi:tripartite-type tricarboxylate transporter receptor subunit TctC
MMRDRGEKNIMKRFGIFLLASLLGTSAAAAQDAVSFQGKTVNMVISSEPGGGTDAFARLVAQYLSNYLPGSPTVVVRNVPGAGGITGMNYMVQQAAPDGYTFVTAGNTMADPLQYRKPQSQFDPAEFGVIGGVGRGGEVLLISKDAEKRLYDKKAAPVIIGSLGGIPRSGAQMAAWGIEYLGWNGKWVIGYRGTNEMMLALERGEIEMSSTGNIFLIKKLIDTGKFKILVQSGALRNGQLVGRPDFGDAPVFSKLMEGKIKEPLAAQAFQYWSAIAVTDKWMALPPKTPKAMVDAHRVAYAKLMDDAEFLEKGRKLSEGFDPMSAPDVEVLVRQLAALPLEATEYMTVILRKQGLDVQ